MGTQPRDAGDILHRFVTDQLISRFNVANVGNLDAKPIITRTIGRGIPEPYIWVKQAESYEIDNTKMVQSREYVIELDCRVKARPNRGNHQILNDIATEAVNVASELEGMNLPGDDHRIYITTSDPVIKHTLDVRGARYFLAVVPMLYRVEALGASAPALPIQESSYTFAGFNFAPTATERIERYDAGAITPATTYPSPNNGYNFVSTSQVVSPAASGTLTNGVYTVGSDDLILALNNTINYQLATDTSMTHAVQNVDMFSRIISLRYGAVADGTFTDNTAATYGLRNLPQWNAGRRTLAFGTSEVENTEITITANAGEAMYIVLNALHPNLTSITENVFNQNILNLFNAPVTIGAYKVYKQTNAQLIDQTFNLTIN